MMGESAGSRAYNGMPAEELRGARWWKSGRSSAQGLPGVTPPLLTTHKRAKLKVKRGMHTGLADSKKFSPTPQIGIVDRNDAT
jgi:hypothetical protein